MFAGSLLIYFETYRNSEFIDGIAHLLILLGWVTLFVEAAKGTPVDDKKILFKEDKGGWLKQRSFIAFAYLGLLALLAGNIFYLYHFSYERRSDILENRPTEKVIAVISGIQARRQRSSTSYYAIFQYTVAGKVIHHPWHEERESDFLVGQQFVIQYSVEYPEMFKIIRTVP